MKSTITTFLLFISAFAFSQTDSSVQQSCPIRISLLTCTPGQELYSVFGHSAIRVVNSADNTDLVFNYGTFDFDDPDFYKKFIKGKLRYFVSVDSLSSFLWEYQYFKRGVTDQVINISCEKKQKMLAALFENAKEENKYYRYDFNYDNCTTRLRDMVEKATGKQLQTKNILLRNNTTFRNLIHDYLNKGGQYWSKLGIDILLGSPLDKKVTNREAMFLPDYLMYAFDSSTNGNQPLVAEKNILIPEFTEIKTKSLVTPFVIFCITLFLIVILSYSGSGASKIFFKIFDFIFFLTLGLLGVLLLFMWFDTNHAMCKNNFNLLWALPTHLPIAFMLFSKKEWVKAYFRFIFFYSLALLAAWFLLPQQLNTALLPVIGIILVRSFFISKAIATESRNSTE